MAESEIKPVRQGQPGDDLVMAGYMGLRGSAAAVRAERGILLRRLPETLLQNILVYEKQQTRRLEGLTGEAAAGAGVSAWYHLGEAGVEGGAVGDSRPVEYRFCGAAFGAACKAGDN